MNALAQLLRKAANQVPQGWGIVDELRDAAASLEAQAPSVPWWVAKQCREAMEISLENGSNPKWVQWRLRSACETATKSIDYAHKHKQPLLEAQEPVAWWNRSIDLDCAFSYARQGGYTTPLYRHPPTSAVPDPLDPEYVADAVFAYGWNACRAAMLAAAPQQGGENET